MQQKPFQGEDVCGKSSAVCTEWNDAMLLEPAIGCGKIL